ncbi:MAG: oxygen-independent coproporphyrinogen III oxidase [Bdellovibrionales bacterium]|nr:oxygen-independent coproporphyrinogen III oxidase [Bdellovibrionales bacterium]
MRNLIDKYAVAAPRYTSYPSYPHWEGPPTEKEWFDNIGANPEIDLYIHIPYCEKLCLYCGCNRQITKNHELERPYLKLLLKEIEIYKRNLGHIKVNNLHFGGGTPTFISAENFDWFLNKLFKLVSKGAHFSGSFEADPRVTQEDHYRVLADYGLDRVSFGIQDFSENVQKAIGRIQPYSMVTEAITMARKWGYQSVNFDIIYGLPLQTQETIDDSFDKVQELSPDTVAFFSYAHVPWKIKHQKALEKYPLSQGREKYLLKIRGERRLVESGYIHLGLDHFVKPFDPLYQAYQQKSLQRNFMGYTTACSKTLIGIGCTSISDASNCYIQNMKSVSDYQNSINQGKLALENGHQLTLEEKTIRDTIQSLFCHQEFDLRSVADVYKCEKLKALIEKIAEFERDDLLQKKGNLYLLTEKGKVFSRNMAMAFDLKLRGGIRSGQFSNSI